MTDYEDWEIQSEKMRTSNGVLLNEFQQVLADSGLSRKTVTKHVSNIDFYINEFLLHYEVTSPADGIHSIAEFLGYWFIRKAMWASEANIKSNCVSFKKFYGYLFERGEVNSADYLDMLGRIKNESAEWQATCRKYDDPDVDLADVW